MLSAVFLRMIEGQTHLLFLHENAVSFALELLKNKKTINIYFQKDDVLISWKQDFCFLFMSEISF